MPQPAFPRRANRGLIWMVGFGGVAAIIAAAAAVGAGAALNSGAAESADGSRIEGGEKGEASAPARAKPAAGTEGSPSAALREAECAALLRELERMRWNISRTAQTLGISRNTLYRKIHKHRILLEH